MLFAKTAIREYNALISLENSVEFFKSNFTLSVDMPYTDSVTWDEPVRNVLWSDSYTVRLSVKYYWFICGQCSSQVRLHVSSFEQLHKWPLKIWIFYALDLIVIYLLELLVYNNNGTCQYLSSMPYIYKRKLVNDFLIYSL